MWARHFEVIAAKVLDVDRGQAQGRSGGQEIEHEFLFVLQALWRYGLVEVPFR
jgi:hypothetical protein